MNQHITRLYQLANKSSRRIIGLMSGTSLDGLDIALCHITGSGINTQAELERFTTVTYDDHFRQAVRSVFSKRQVDLERLTVLNAWIAQEHGRMIIDTLARWGIDAKQIDLVASHGQTVYHAPKSLHPDDEYGHATLQIGDGDHLAAATGIITISDFRQKHIAGGGEGAPLAVYGDFLVFGKEGENRILLNIGGIANFTYLPAKTDSRGLFSTDTGPGNTLMDAYMQQYFGMACDRDAAQALQGKIEPGLLDTLMDHPFFSAPFPKTTGPELFSLAYLANAQKKTGTVNIPHADVMATLNRFTAITIASVIRSVLTEKEIFTIYTSGGGMHNPLLMQHLQSLLPGHTFETTDQLNIAPDAKEAVLFAILANEAVAGGNTPIPGIPAVSMGKISFPG